MKNTPAIAMFIGTITLMITACQSQPSNTQPSITPIHSSNKSLDSQQHHKLYNPDTLIVFYNPDKKSSVMALLDKLNTKIIYDYQNFNGLAIKVNPNHAQSIKHTLQNNPDILSVEYDTILQLQ